MEKRKIKHKPIKIDNFDYEKDSPKGEKREEKPSQGHSGEKDKAAKKDYSPEQDSVQSTKNLFFALGFILLLFAVFFGVRFFYDSDVRDTYNGFSCQEHNNFTYCQIMVNEREIVDGVPVITRSQEFSLEFRNPPWEVENITLMGNVTQLVNNSNTGFIYIAIPADIADEDLAKAGIAAIEISRLLGERYDIYNIPSKSALINETVDYEVDIPKVNCQNATNGTAVIMFGLGDRTFVSKQGDCYVVAGETPDDIIRAADRLAYTVTGIMPPKVI